MNYNKIVFKIFIICANLILLYSIFITVYTKYKDYNKVIVPINNIVLQLVYISIYIIGYINHTSNNYHNIIFFVIMFILQITFLLLSLKINIINYIKNIFIKNKS